MEKFTTILWIMYLQSAIYRAEEQPMSVQIPIMNEVKSRIIGGSEVTPHSYPFQVHIKMFNKISNVASCGGSLISKKIVLTAAHCLDGRPSLVAIKLGKHVFSKYEKSEKLYFTSTYRSHGGYYGKECKDDIALVQLNEDVDLDGETVSTVELARDPTKLYVDEQATIVGWGMTDSQAQSPELRSVDVKVLDQHGCVFQTYSKIYPTQICTSGAGPKGACVGDSGGAVLVDGVQVGIVSCLKLHSEEGDTREHCMSGLPTIHTRVAMYKDWIDRALSDPGFFNKGCTKGSNIIFVLCDIFILLAHF
ncbi:unnamed protein product [Acanthoscelides obtectus]|uniref:Peptidase S1 domain-containing protein n=1 Tax=Acanthoscelides obtectus TaxID=200917 RepID=A0A9P0QCF2_ACAOB|nr:unnamed protein product [Acanthoscelides obtectus]CAK1660824.1 hypothetical protein AOBTE_LOCUS22281 [Acanthoscelides obtectus]